MARRVSRRISRSGAETPCSGCRHFDKIFRGEKYTVSCDALTPAVAISQGASHTGGKMDLKNAVALITGGSSGIGRAIAESLTASGARVAITGRDEGRLTEAARAIGAHPIHANVALEADVERTYREVLQKFGDLDILVNNAGVGVFKNL